MIGWQSPTIPQLQSENPPVGNEPMTNEAASWLTGIMCLTAALTSLIVGAILNRFGHKVTGYLIALAHCTSWLFTIFATQQTHLFIGLFFSGISGGMTLFSVPLYVSEIASDGIRGMLGSLMVFVLNGGILFAYVLGALLPYQWYSITMFAFPLFYIVTFLFVPESPVYLMRNNRINEASRQAQAFFFFSCSTNRIRATSAIFVQHSTSYFPQISDMVERWTEVGGWARNVAPAAGSERDKRLGAMDEQTVRAVPRSGNDQRTVHHARDVLWATTCRDIYYGKKKKHFNIYISFDLFVLITYISSLFCR